MNIAHINAADAASKPVVAIIRMFMCAGILIEKLLVYLFWQDYPVSRKNAGNVYGLAVIFQPENDYGADVDHANRDFGNDCRDALAAPQATRWPGMALVE